MNILNNLAVKSKLTFMLLFPLLGLLIFASLESKDYYNQYESMNKLRKVTILATKISSMVHEFQKERGLTASYLVNKAKKFNKELTIQKELMDKKIKEYESYLHTLDILNEKKHFRDLVQKSNNKLEKISDVRRKILSLDLKLNNALSYYTNTNNSFLNVVLGLSDFSNDAEFSKEIGAYSTFLYAKDETGLERALGTVIFSNDKFKPGMRRKFTTLVSQQDAYLYMFLHYASEKTKKFYEKTVSGNIIKDVNEMRNVILNGNAIGGLGVDASLWFDTITQKINLLKRVDDYQSNLLIHDANEISNNAYNGLMIILGFATVIVIIAVTLGILISNRIVISLNTFQSGLEDFFSFLNYESEDIVLLENNNKDEFGEMTKDINKNILKTKENILQDRKVIDETIEISNRINKGHLDGKILNSSANPALNELKGILNNTIDGLNDNMQNIQKVLVSYTNLNYLPIIEKDSMEGVIAQLIDDINTLGETITQTLVINKSNGLILEKDADVLLENVESLNNTSNEAASSLEETAAALEEITSTIVNNNVNLNTMTQYADNVTKSAKTGKDLANNTMSAMDEINERIISINETITVIDQIAFQTNILSLNAAVEAATAGEAGKGFAVVAQEVRNLASRASESAKQIKEIVSDATTQANLGKEIAENMLVGYEELNVNIDKTITLMYDVDASSKEQQSGIEQINLAVAQIDQQTQLNAAASAQTHEIAVGTKKLSESIVNEANKKEFRGKNQDKKREKTQSLIKDKYEKINENKQTNLANTQDFNNVETIKESS